MTQRCYVCGRTEDEYNQYFIEQSRKKLAGVGDIHERAVQLKNEIDTRRDLGLRTSLSDTDKMVLSIEKSSNYSSKISKLKEYIEKIKTEPLSIMSYPIEYQKDVNSFISLIGKMDNEFLVKYGSWDKNKFNSALNCEYPFGSEAEKKLIKDCLEIGKSPEYVAGYPQRCIDEIQSEIEQCGDDMDMKSNESIPEPFKTIRYKHGNFDVTVCPICHTLYFDDSVLRFY